MIGFCYDDARHGTQLFAMRPDEALIQARMLIAAVYSVTEGYEVGQLRLSIHESVVGERREVFGDAPT